MNSTTTRPNSIIFDLIALTKPRVNFLIIFTAIVGMLLAQDYDLNYSLMIYASIGIYLAASAAAVINQIVDQKIDAIMDRTKSRPLIKGNVTSGHAIFFSIGFFRRSFTSQTWLGSARKFAKTRLGRFPKSYFS